MTATTLATQPPTSSLRYVATVYDTLPGIASRFYVQSGYSSFARLLADMMAANLPAIVDWTASLDGATVFVPVLTRAPA